MKYDTPKKIKKRSPEWYIAKEVCDTLKINQEVTVLVKHDRRAHFSVHLNRISKRTRKRFKTRVMEDGRINVLRINPKLEPKSADAIREVNIKLPEQDYAKAKKIVFAFELGDFMFVTVRDLTDFERYIGLLTPEDKLFTIRSVSYLNEAKIRVMRVR